MRLVSCVCGAAALVSVLMATGVARADVLPFSVGARVGYAKYVGDASSDLSFLPIQADAMYHVGFGLRVGAYGSYAPGLGKPDGVDSASLLRAGIQAHFRLPLPLVHPWVGVGTGYQRGSITSDVLGQKATTTDSGWERFNLQAGLQFGLLPILELGPYVQYENGTFGDEDATARINAGLRAEIGF